MAVQHARAEEAARRAAEANALFSLSRSLATATSTAEAARRDRRTRARRRPRSSASGSVAGPPSAERLLADTGNGPPADPPPASHVISASPGRPATSRPAGCARTPAIGRRRDPAATDDRQYRVRIEVDDVQLGTLVALARSRGRRHRPASETRVLALAADQIAVSLRRDQLRQTATELEVARQTDVLKTALIDSVSHDLRTPLASIRATAGGLADPEVAVDR